MFEEMVVSSPNPKKTNKSWTVVVSMLFQVAFLSILILIPLIYTEALPKTMMATMLTAPPPDAHFRYRAFARHHFQRWLDSAAGSHLRPPAAAAERAGCRAPVALSTDSSQWRAG